MDLLQLKYFQVVARKENMTRAAEELHIAQPSLSKTISRLENDVGVPLFERRGRQFRLNQFGKVFLQKVDQSLNDLEEGLRQVSDLAGLDHGSVTVGATASRLLPDLFRDYLTLRPGVKLRLLQVTQLHEIRERLTEGEIDLCISSLPIHQPGILCKPLMKEEIFLAVPPMHRLAGRKSIQLKEIAGEPFIHQTTECGLREITNDFCQQAGFTANIAFESTTPEVICSLVAAGFGIAFMPADWWGGHNTESLVKLHIASPTCRRTIWLSWVEKRYISEAARDFSRFVVQYFSQTGKEDNI